ncbi:hypothetical protein [Sphingobium estronivorans]|nr:hypothetical protein [Sphingobium estronivorans]
MTSASGSLIAQAGAGLRVRDLAQSQRFRPRGAIDSSARIYTKAR